MGGDDKIQMEVVLDTSKALGDVDKLAQATADKLRHNPAIDELFGDTPAKKSKDDVDRKEYLKRREKLADDERWNARYNTREGKAEVAAKRAFLKQQVTSGRERIAEGKRERYDASSYWYRVDQERGRRRREQLKEERRIVDAADRAAGEIGGRLGRAAGRAGTIGYAATAGAVAYGFKGTVEGNQFSNEMKLLSRELAGIFKPALQALTGMVQATRGALETLSPSQQNRIMNVGLAIGAGLLVNRVAGGGLFGGALSAVHQTLGGGLAGAARIGLYGGAAYAGYDMLRSGAMVRSAGTDPTTDYESRSAGFYRGMPREDRDRLLARHNARTNADMRESDSQEVGFLESINPLYAQFSGKRSFAGKMLSTMGVNPVDGSGVYTDRNRAVSIQRRMKLFGNDGEVEANDQKVKSADTVGFGALGSTADMIQESLAAQGGRNTESWPERIYWFLIGKFGGGVDLSLPEAAK